MTDKANGEAPARPRIVIEFAGPLQADCAINYSDGLTTGQLYAAAWTLDAVAHEFRAAEIGGGAKGLAMAPKDALALLDRLGIKVPGREPHKAHG